MAIRIRLISFKFHYTNMCREGWGDLYFHNENKVNVRRRKVPMQMSARLNVADYVFSQAFTS